MKRTGKEIKGTANKKNKIEQAPSGIGLLEYVHTLYYESTYYAPLSTLEKGETDRTMSKHNYLELLLVLHAVGHAIQKSTLVAQKTDLGQYDKLKDMTVKFAREMLTKMEISLSHVPIFSKDERRQHMVVIKDDPIYTGPNTLTFRLFSSLVFTEVAKLIMCVDTPQDISALSPIILTDLDNYARCVPILEHLNRLEEQLGEGSNMIDSVFKSCRDYIASPAFCELSDNKPESASSQSTRACLDQIAADYIHRMTYPSQTKVLCYKVFNKVGDWIHGRTILIPLQLAIYRLERAIEFVTVFFRSFPEIRWLNKHQNDHYQYNSYTVVSYEDASWVWANVYTGSSIYDPNSSIRTKSGLFYNKPYMLTLSCEKLMRLHFMYPVANRRSQESILKMLQPPSYNVYVGKQRLYEIFDTIIKFVEDVASYIGKDLLEDCRQRYNLDSFLYIGSDILAHASTEKTVRTSTVPAEVTKKCIEFLHPLVQLVLPRTSEIDQEDLIDQPVDMLTDSDSDLWDPPTTPVLEEESEDLIIVVNPTATSFDADFFSFSFTPQLLFENVIVQRSDQYIYGHCIQTNKANDLPLEHFVLCINPYNRKKMLLTDEHRIKHGTEDKSFIPISQVVEKWASKTHKDTNKPLYYLETMLGYMIDLYISFETVERSHNLFIAVKQVNKMYTQAFEGFTSNLELGEPTLLWPLTKCENFNLILSAVFNSKPIITTLDQMLKHKFYQDFVETRGFCFIHEEACHIINYDARSATVAGTYSEMLQSDMSTELSVVADPKGPEKMEFLNTVTDFFSRVTENRKYNRKGNPFKKSTAQPIPFVGSLKITFKTEDGISEGLGYGITQQFLSVYRHLVCEFQSSKHFVQGSTPDVDLYQSERYWFALGCVFAYCLFHPNLCFPFDQWPDYMFKILKHGPSVELNLIDLLKQEQNLAIQFISLLVNCPYDLGVAETTKYIKDTYPCDWDYITSKFNPARLSGPVSGGNLSYFVKCAIKKVLIGNQYDNFQALHDGFSHFKWDLEVPFSCIHATFKKKFLTELVLSRLLEKVSCVFVPQNSEVHHTNCMVAPSSSSNTQTFDGSHRFRICTSHKKKPSSSYEICVFSLLREYLEESENRVANFLYFATSEINVPSNDTEWKLSIEANLCDAENRPPLKSILNGYRQCKLPVSSTCTKNVVFQVPAQSFTITNHTDYQGFYNIFIQKIVPALVCKNFYLR